MLTTDKRHKEMLEYYKQQPYETKIEGIHLTIAKDCFPSDKALASKKLAKLVNTYRPNNAIDMGCGAGLLALILAKNGCENVIAIEHHKPAYECAKLNIVHHKREKQIHLFHGDLFKPLENTALAKKYDFIVFNHPYFPTDDEPVFGSSVDDGQNVLTRFFDTCREFITRDTIILIPSANFIAPEHDPVTIASKFGFENKLIEKFSENGVENYINEFKFFFNNYEHKL